MAAPKPTPVILTAASSNPDSTRDPQKIVVVGGLPAATSSVAGGVKRAPAQVASTATDVAGLLTDFNALLTKLRASGVLAP
jgi:hypothetical protein